MVGVIQGFAFSVFCLGWNVFLGAFVELLLKICGFSFLVPLWFLDVELLVDLSGV